MHYSTRHLFLPLVPLLHAAASPTAASGLWALQVCSNVASKLPGTIAYPQQSIYNASQTSFYTTEERDLAPSCVFRPETAADVSAFVKLVASAGNSTQFAIRSGGHMLFSAAANIESGITVDMRGLDQVVVSEDQLSAAVGKNILCLLAFIGLRQCYSTFDDTC